MKRIWKHEPTLEQLNQRGKGSMVEHLGITFTALGPDYLSASMPVDHRTKQPAGLLHGGASVVLAETVGSVAGSLCVDLHRHFCVGLEVNANHLRAIRAGLVVGTAQPLHLGQRTQVWQIDIVDEDGWQITASRFDFGHTGLGNQRTCTGRPACMAYAVKEIYYTLQGGGPHDRAPRSIFALCRL